MFAVDASTAIATSCTHTSVPPLFVPFLAVEPSPVTSTGDDYSGVAPTGQDGHDSHEDHEVSEPELSRVFSV